MKGKWSHAGRPPHSILGEQRPYVNAQGVTGFTGFYSSFFFLCPIRIR